MLSYKYATTYIEGTCLGFTNGVHSEIQIADHWWNESTLSLALLLTYMI